MLVTIGTLGIRQGDSPESGEAEYTGSTTWNSEGTALDMVALNDAPYLREKTQAEKKIDAAAAARAAINAERNRREQAGFAYLGKIIDSDAVSVQRISVACTTAQMALSAGVPYEVQWACQDNSLLTLDAPAVLGMMQALGSYGLTLHYYARTLKDAVAAAADPDSVDITIGWPG